MPGRFEFHSFGTGSIRDRSCRLARWIAPGVTGTLEDSLPSRRAIPGPAIRRECCGGYGRFVAAVEVQDFRNELTSAPRMSIT